MKTNINNEHNSIELDFEGAKPSEEVRELLKAYGFWWFGKGKVWCHTLAVDPDFFKDFVTERIAPLVSPAKKATSLQEIDISGMSEETKKALAALLGL